MGHTAMENHLYYTYLDFLIVKPNNVFLYLGFYILIFYVHHKIYDLHNYQVEHHQSSFYLVS